MARYLGSKNKLARRFGEDLGLKSNAAKLAKRINIKPGQHGTSRVRRKLTDYAVQLKEKQKAKFIYGILEKQMVKIYKEASSSDVSTGLMILILLERRLDNVIYRAGWAITRAQARQFIAHNHILINGKRMDIPSYEVKTNDVIEIRKKALSIGFVKENLKNSSEEGKLVGWLDAKAHIAKVKNLPNRDDIRENIDEQLIVEFYSR
jgi:small subunit ribosomal protein S4